MKSLRARLTGGVGGVVATCLTAFSVVLYLGVARELHGSFDASLLAQAESFAAMAEDPAPAPWDFEYSSVSAFETATRPSYFEVWRDTGEVLGRSGSLHGGDLLVETASESPRYLHLTLPDGREGRAVVIRRLARGEKPGTLGRPVVAEVARATDETSGALARLAWLLAGLTLLGSAVGAAVGAFIIARGLQPVIALSEQLTKMRVGDLETPLRVEGLPTELAPLVIRLNDALHRLGKSFARERRFTADVSHELRTPLAALRLTLEVTASAPRTVAEYTTALNQAIESVEQLQSLATNLLMLARIDAGGIEIQPDDVPLRALGEAAWKTYAPVAQQRRLRFDNRVPPEAMIRTDPAKFKVILDTLLSNAASHTAEGGEIVLGPGAPDGLLEVWDSGPEISSDFLPRLFERFSKGDAARSDSDHHGIGLSIARAMASALALEVHAENKSGGVRFLVRQVGVAVDAPH